MNKAYLYFSNEHETSCMFMNKAYSFAKRLFIGINETFPNVSKTCVSLIRS